MRFDFTRKFLLIVMFFVCLVVAGSAAPPAAEARCFRGRPVARLLGRFGYRITHPFGGKFRR